jgi:hypothetical protein
VKYIDLNSGVVKTSHHATFNEAWYLQPTRPPAAQLLYDMGLEYDDATMTTDYQSPRMPSSFLHPPHTCRYTSTMPHTRQFRRPSPKV